MGFFTDLVRRYLGIEITEDEYDTLCKAAGHACKESAKAMAKARRSPSPMRSLLDALRP